MYAYTILAKLALIFLKVITFYLFAHLELQLMLDTLICSSRVWFVVRKITCSRYIASLVVSDNNDNLHAITDAHHRFEIAVLVRKRDRLCVQKALKCPVLRPFFGSAIFPLCSFQ